MEDLPTPKRRGVIDALPQGFASDVVVMDEGSGSDIDVAVRDLDPLWPLRLFRSRLLQRLAYDASGIQWYLATDEGVIALDTLEDPRGIGRYAFPTPLLFTAERGGALATYRCLKSGVKRRALDEATVEIARRDPEGFRATLGAVAGSEGESLADSIVATGSADDAQLRAVARTARRRRLVSPVRATHLLAGQSARAMKRLTQPAGLYVLVVGPDGTGKSTLAAALAEADLPFRSTRRLHWRPGILPQRGDPSGSAATTPHAGRQRSAAASVAVLVYHWLDAFIGGWTTIMAARWRAHLVIQERGWWDVAVDPRRYRLRVNERLVRVLGALLVGPDVVLRLDTDAATVMERSDELPRAEIDRQVARWGAVSPSIGGEVAALDARLRSSDVAAAATAALQDHLANRAHRRIGAGWAVFGKRWWLPRGPRPVAHASTVIYRPSAHRARVAAAVGRTCIAAGAARLARRSDLPDGVIDVLAPVLAPRETFALAKANHPGRYTAAIVNDEGEVRAFVKLGLSATARAALEVEADALERFGVALPEPLRPPRLLDRADGVLILAAAQGRPPRPPEILPPSIAPALGAFFAATGAHHGDVAPWNLLRQGDAWLLLDWEHARASGRAFYDLWHYIVQTHALLGRPSTDAIRAGIDGTGWIADRISGYARAADLDHRAARPALITYLEASRANIDPTTRDGRRGLEARDHLMRILQ